MRISDWSSDVCSSDLAKLLHGLLVGRAGRFQAVLGLVLAEGLAGLRSHDPVDLQIMAFLLQGLLYGLHVLTRTGSLRLFHLDRKSTRLNSSHYCASRLPSSA